MEMYHSHARVLSDLFGSYRRHHKDLLMGRTTETSWWRNTDTSLGVPFATCLRRHEDVLRRRWRNEDVMGRRCYVLLRCRHNVPIKRRGNVPLRRLGGAPSTCRWVFDLRRTYDVAGTYKETSSRHRYDILL